MTSPSTLPLAGGDPAGERSPIYLAPYQRRPERARIYLSQYNQIYDREVFLPYSVGMLAAHARTNPDFVANFEIVDLPFERDTPARIVERFEDPWLLGWSIYVWNSELSLRAARLAKQRFPDALIVFGGPSVPNEGEDFLRANPFIDVLVHGEGEIAFLELCLARLRGLDLHLVDGLSFLDGDAFVKTGSRHRVKTLDQLASPFLDGTFEPLFERPYKFHVIWETNRGCPFDCSFCYWGSNLKAKISKFGIDRLDAEMDWFVDHRIDFIYAADANFGIDRRDLDIARRLVERKHASGHPKTFVVNYLKNSNEKVFELARLLHTEGLCKGATLSLQSLDAQVLENIKRANIKMSTFKTLQRMYREARIPSYTELILGLAGETLAGFLDGIETTIGAGEHDQIYVYLCRVLPNTDMDSREHRTTFGIETRWIPIMANHAALAESDPVAELEEIVVGTAAMPVADWARALTVSWFVQTFFCLKLAYFVLLYLRTQLHVPITAFASWFVDRVRRLDAPLCRRELDRIEAHVASLLAAEPRVDMSDIGAYFPIKWPVEEVTLLKLAFDRDAWYAELRRVVDAFLAERNLACDAQILDEVFAYQRARVVHFDGPGAQREVTFEHNVPEMFERAIALESIPVVRRRSTLRVDENVRWNDKDEFARFQVWYGRRGKSFYYPAEWT